MKRLIHTLFISLFLGQLTAQTVHYVNAAAPAGGNGSSWLTAYNKLDDALSIANPGDQIWVRQGTYKPNGTAVTATFALQPGVKLYGGFEGVETALSSRNPAIFVTTLSGDLLGDDVSGDFTQKRTDNVRHVISVLSNGNPNDIALVDGFTISGGQTSVNTADPANDRRGAGILALAKLTTLNCIFKDHHGASGVSIAAIGAPASGLLVDGCTFQNCESTSQSAGILMGGMSAGTVKNSVFKNNVATRGCLYPNTCTGIVIDSCLFESNTASNINFGAAFFSFQSSFSLKNSIFRTNSSGNAAAMYCDNRSFGQFYTVDNCLFEDNVATNYGGTGIFNFKTTYEVRNSTFKGNTAPSAGAAIYNSDTTVFLVKGCLFEGQESSFSPAAANYGIGCDGTYEDCTFMGNIAQNGGGAASNGFKANTGYKNCTFKGNTAGYGGAIFTQNDTTRITIDGCLFEENGAVGTAGAVLINNNIAGVITDSEFKANSADIGAALSIDGDSTVTVSNTIFIDNLATSQAGAVNILNGQVTMTNCLFAKNLNLSATGAGGAISNNGFDEKNSNLKLVNCTLAENVAGIGSGIASFQDTSGVTLATVTLQNCLLQQTGYDNYGVEAGTPTVVSLGGNQSSDPTLEAFLTGTKDLNNEEAVFVNVDQSDFHILLSSAVDGGIKPGAPLDDLEGNPRIGSPDRGCYEWGTSSVFQPGLKVLPITLAPNPTVDRVMISLNDTWSGNAQLEIFAQDGALVSTLSVNKVSGAWTYNLGVTDLPAGSYRMRLLTKDTQYQALLVKQ